MDPPMLPSQQKLSPNVDLEEKGELNAFDVMTNGFCSVRSQLCATHVIEDSEKNVKENGEKLRLSTVRQVQGLHAPLRLMFERNAVKKVQRLPFLPSSNIALETLLGRDETLDFDDNIFFDPEEGIESLAVPHMVMEKHLFPSK